MIVILLGQIDLSAPWLVAGVILITLLQSILSVVKMPDAGRQIIYGLVIIAMLLLYGRESGTR